MQSNFLET